MLLIINMGATLKRAACGVTGEKKTVVELRGKERMMIPLVIRAGSQMMEKMPTDVKRIRGDEGG